MSELQFAIVIIGVVIVCFVLAFFKSKPLRFLLGLVLFAAAALALTEWKEKIDHEDRMARGESEHIKRMNQLQRIAGDGESLRPATSLPAFPTPVSPVVQSTPRLPQPTPDPAKEILQKYGTRSPR